MAVTSTPVFPQTPSVGPVQIVNADAQNQKTVYTAGANGSKVVAVMATSTDTSARDLQLSVTRSGTSYPIGTVTCASGAGNSGTVPSTDLIPNLSQMPGLPIDSDGNSYIFLKSGDTLTVSALTSVTNTKTITVVAVGADF